MQIVRIEEDGKVLVVAEDDKGIKVLKRLDWDIFCGADVTFPDQIEPLTLDALQTLLPAKKP